MSYDDGFGPTPPQPGPAYPFPNYQPPATTNSFTYTNRPTEVATGAKIFTDVDAANKFMEGLIIHEVVIQVYETSGLEGMLITVYFEVDA